MSPRQASLHPGQGVTLLEKSCAAKALSRMCSVHEAREAACGAGAVQGIMSSLISLRDNLDAKDPFTCEACMWLCYCLASLFRNASCLGLCCRQNNLHPIVNLLHRRFPWEFGWQHVLLFAYWQGTNMASDCFWMRVQWKVYVTYFGNLLILTSISV